MTTTIEETISNLNDKIKPYILTPSIVNVICVNYTIPSILILKGYYNT